MLNFDPVVILSLSLVRAWSRGVHTEVEPSIGSTLYLESAKYLGAGGFSRQASSNVVAEKAARKPFMQDPVLGSCHMCTQKMQRPDGTSGACRGSREMCYLC